MGIVGAGVNLGPAVGPVLGGLLSKELGWPSHILVLCHIFLHLADSLGHVRSWNVPQCCWQWFDITAEMELDLD